MTDVEFAGDAVDAWFEVADDVRPLITTRSVAVIGAISMLGEGALDITPAPGGTPIPDWGYVPSAPSPGSIAALSESASAGLNETNLLLADLRAGKGTLGTSAHRRRRLSRDGDADAGGRPGSRPPWSADGAASASW